MERGGKKRTVHGGTAEDKIKVPRPSGDVAALEVAARRDRLAGGGRIKQVPEVGDGWLEQTRAPGGERDLILGEHDRTSDQHFAFVAFGQLEVHSAGFHAD